MTDRIKNDTSRDPRDLRAASESGHSESSSVVAEEPKLECTEGSNGARAEDPAVASLVNQFTQSILAQKEVPEPRPRGVHEVDAGFAPVLNVGFSASTESIAASLATIATQVPGGAAISTGMYVDFDNLEIGSYTRYEVRWGSGAYAGAGLELGITRNRASFEGESEQIFAEGGALQKFGVTGNESAIAVSYGVGAGSAGGLAVTVTETEPSLRLDEVLDWGPSFLRRGP